VLEQAIHTLAKIAGAGPEGPELEHAAFLRQTSPRLRLRNARWTAGTLRGNSRRNTASQLN